MFGLKRSDLWRLLGLTVLGVISLVVCVVALDAWWDPFGPLTTTGVAPWRPFGLSVPGPRWTQPGLEFLAIFWLSFFLSGTLVLSLGPTEGRIRFRSFAAVCLWPSLICTPLVVATTWWGYMLSSKDPLFKHFDVINRAMMILTFSGVTAWPLTWSLDAVRRRRRALDAAGKEPPA